MTKTELKKEISSHNKRNLELLEILLKKGLSETDEVDAEYHFWAYDHEDAVTLARKLYEDGFTILVISPVEDDEGIYWNVEARKRGIIQDVVSASNTDHLANLANDQGSIYDGWGTRI